MTTFIAMLIIATVVGALVETGKQFNGRGFSQFNKNNGSLNAGAAC